MILLSSLKASFWVTFLAAMTLVIGAVYTLWMYKRVFYGPITNPKVANLPEMKGIDCTIFILLTAAVFFIGLYPQGLLRLMHPTIGHLLEISTQTKI